MSRHTMAHDYAGLAAEAAGNHRKFESFGWFERPADDENWCIVYTSNRDSGLLDQSNAAAIEKALEPFLEAEEPDIFAESHSHWAVGHVDGYAIRVYREHGNPETITDAFKAWCDIAEQLDDYSILDEDDYFNREYEATLENIRDVGRRFVADGAPEDWDGQVFSWFWDHAQREVENRDDQGGYPSDEGMKNALYALGWLDEEYMDEEESE